MTIMVDQIVARLTEHISPDDWQTLTKEKPYHPTHAYKIDHGGKHTLYTITRKNDLIYCASINDEQLEDDGLSFYRLSKKHAQLLLGQSICDIVDLGYKYSATIKSITNEPHGGCILHCPGLQTPYIPILDVPKHSNKSWKNRNTLKARSQRMQVKLPLIDETILRRQGPDAIIQLADGELTRPHFPDGTAVYLDDYTDRRYQKDGCYITPKYISVPTVIPQSMLDAAIGKPVTNLVQHPLLEGYLMTKGIIQTKRTRIEIKQDRAKRTLAQFIEAEGIKLPVIRNYKPTLSPLAMERNNK